MQGLIRAIRNPPPRLLNTGSEAGQPAMSDEAEAEAEAMQLQWQLRSAGLLPAPAEVEAYLGEFDVSADRGQTDRHRLHD